MRNVSDKFVEPIKTRIVIINHFIPENPTVYKTMWTNVVSRLAKHDSAMCTCVHVYMCTCVHVYMYTCVHVYAGIHTHMYTLILLNTSCIIDVQFRLI
jgi:hypothetical protein